MITRASFLARGALAACAAGGAGAVGPFLATALAQNPAGDVSLLQLALTLERVEGELYRRAVRETDLDREVRALARDFGRHEAEHEQAIIELIGKLGGEPAPAPDLVDERTLRSQASFLRDLQLLEDTGVGAYNAAGPLVRNPDVLAVAGSIVQVEARHAATIRLLRDEDPAPTAFDEPVSAREALRRTGPFVR